MKSLCDSGLSLTMGHCMTPISQITSIASEIHDSHSISGVMKLLGFAIFTMLSINKNLSLLLKHVSSLLLIVLGSF